MYVCVVCMWCLWPMTLVGFNSLLLPCSSREITQVGRLGSKWTILCWLWTCCFLNLRHRVLTLWTLLSHFYFSLPNITSLQFKISLLSASCSVSRSTWILLGICFKLWMCLSVRKFLNTVALARLSCLLYQDLNADLVLQCFLSYAWEC